MRYLMLKIALAAVAILLQTSTGFACTCAPKRSVLDEFDSAPVVVIARVTSLDETITDENGVFEIYGLPAGNYRLVPELPPGLNIDPNWVGFSEDLFSNSRASRTWPSRSSHKNT